MQAQALVAFSEADNDGKIIWWSPGIHDSVVAWRGSAMEVGIIPYCEIRERFPDDVPESGLWVWDGTATENNGTLTLHGTWRSPTSREWAAIRRGANPWYGPKEMAHAG